MSLYHGLGSLENTSPLQMRAVENLDIRNANAFNPLPPLSEHIFDSLPDAIEEDPDYHLSRSSLLGPDTEQALHSMLLEGLLQEHPPPSAMYSEVGPSWVSSSPNDHHHHEQHLSPYSVLGLHPPPQFHPTGPQPAYAESSFQGSWRQSPMRELLFDVHAPARDTAGAPTWPPQISQPDLILWPSNPRHSFPTPAAFDSGDGPRTPPLYLPLTRSNGRISPSPYPGNMQRQNRPYQQRPAVHPGGGGIWIPETWPGASTLHALRGELPPSPSRVPEYLTSVNILNIPIQAFPSSPASPTTSSPPPDAAPSCGMDFLPQT
ncbi:hypothetical protein JB92DRAFT_3108376 [Gautieria morchelliformis]|nr:hypothetical protein JB92DRAFT_3108376 [Gautieria morchelliformis]